MNLLEKYYLNKNNFSRILYISLLFLIVITALIISRRENKESVPLTFFEENFERIELNEASKMSGSKSPSWWLNSGGYFYSDQGKGSTFQGEVPKENQWYKKYKKNNSNDTDDGLHPQNIFRLVTRSKWKNLNQKLYFYINGNNLSASENRNESNGVLLFNRYKDGDNLYYAGVRVDGQAVIKKKLEGKYYTMAIKKIFDGEYDREKSPNLLPQKGWYGIKSEVITNSDNSVTIRLYIDENRQGKWTLILTAVDDNKKYGGPAILEKGYAGIRSDFMDLKFDDYRIEEIETK